MTRVAFVMVALAGLPLGCQRVDAPAAAPVPVPLFPWFEDVTEQVGLDFVHDAGPLGDYFMPQQVGSGAAFFDFNNDSRLDIHLLQNGGPKSTSTNRLYRQMPDGRFRDEVSAHLGRGKATRMESIEISWPDGSREIFDKGHSVDQRLEVRKGEGRPTVSLLAPRGNEK